MLDMPRTLATESAMSYWDDHIVKGLHSDSIGCCPEHGNDVMDFVVPLAWLRDCRVLLQ